MSPAAARIRAWTLFLAGVAFIALTLEHAYEVSVFLRSRGYLWLTIQTLFAVSAAVITYLLVVGAGLRSPWVFLRSLPALGLFLLLMVKLRTNPAERFHFLEYGVLYLLALRACALDLRGAWPYLPAFAVTAAAGWFDEGMQGLSPLRHYDPEDVWMNVIAAAAATLLCFSLFALEPTRARFPHLRRAAET